VVARLVEREPPAVSVAEYSVEVEAPPETVWEVVSDPRNLPNWDGHIRAVHLPDGGLRPGARYEVEMAFVGVRATVPCEVLEWEPPWRSSLHLGGLLDATVTTTVAALPFERSVLRHEVRYIFKGPLGGFGAASVNAVGGASFALRRGTLAQRREIERRAAAGR
jgi:ligand-binding SRPBCC domain-containing protein